VISQVKPVLPLCISCSGKFLHLFGLHGFCGLVLKCNVLHDNILPVSGRAKWFQAFAASAQQSGRINTGHCDPQIDKEINALLREIDHAESFVNRVTKLSAGWQETFKSWLMMSQYC
jgi:hypothetical protein